MKKLAIIFNLLAWSIFLQAQTSYSKTPEFQLSYFGDFFAFPSTKVGVHFPVKGTTKIIDKDSKKRGSFTKTKFRQLKVGGNLAFYQQQSHHHSFLANLELSYQRTKSKSFAPDKFRHFEAAIGVGYYRYQLKGTTFEKEGTTFKEINGNGNALMPSLSVGWGRTIRFIKKTDVRYFTKGALYFEIPHGIGTLPHLVFEFGIASSLVTRK